MTVFLFIENLLTGSKSQNLNNELTNTISTFPSCNPEHDENSAQTSINDRHERTGSVKFADQSDEGKEVRILFVIDRFKYHRVRKVRTVHIVLDRRTTIMAFIECTDLY